MGCQLCAVERTPLLRGADGQRWANCGHRNLARYCLQPRQNRQLRLPARRSPAGRWRAGRRTRAQGSHLASERSRVPASTSALFRARGTRAMQNALPAVANASAKSGVVSPNAYCHDGPAWRHKHAGDRHGGCGSHAKRRRPDFRQSFFRASFLCRSMSSGCSSSIRVMALLAIVCCISDCLQLPRNRL